MADNDNGIRWMVNFWHADGDRTTETDFPEIAFWHPSKWASQVEAARVLWELRERGDERDWIASGHPDPVAGGPWAYIRTSWTLDFSEIESDGNGGAKIKSIAGFGIGNPYWEDLAKSIERRRAAVDAMQDAEYRR